MRTIDVAKFLGCSPISRPLVRDLLNLAKNTQEKEIMLDFSGVAFASRSFMDEFYNVFLKEDNINFGLKIKGMNKDLQAMLAAVKKTQHGSVSTLSFNSNDNVYKAKDIEDFDNFLIQCLQQ